MEYTNSRIAALIDEYIHSERDRKLIKRRLIDGILDLRPFRFGQRTANQVVDAVAHHRRIVLDGVRRVARQFQRVVAGIAQVVDGVEQRAV